MGSLPKFWPRQVVLPAGCRYCVPSRQLQSDANNLGGIPHIVIEIERTPEGFQSDEPDLGGMAGGANEIAQYRHVGPVSPYTACIYGEAEPLGHFEVDPGVIELERLKPTAGAHDGLRSDKLGAAGGACATRG